MRTYQWIVAAMLALLTHLGLAYGFLQEQKHSLGGALADGEGGVEIGLGYAGSYKDQLASRQAPLEKEKTQQKPVQKKPPAKSVTDAVQKKPPTPPLPKKAAAQSKPAPLTPETLPPLNAQALPSAMALPAQTAQPSSTSEQKQLATQVAESSATGNHQQSMRKGSGSANSKRGGGNKGDAKSYFSALMAHLAQFKHYPPELKKAKTQGVVTLAFSLSRSGEVSAARVKKSSGHKALDNAALRMLREASPLPGIPPEFNKQTIKISIPVEYSLITNQSFKE